MSSINLYKIDEERLEEFTRDLLKKMNYVKTVERKGRVPNGDEESFGLTLYLARPEQQKDISCNWVLEELHSAAANGRWCGDQRPPCGLKTAG